MFTKTKQTAIANGGKHNEIGKERRKTNRLHRSSDPMPYHMWRGRGFYIYL